eukprot:UN04668
MHCINRLCPQLRDNIGGYREDIAEMLHVENIVISIADFETTFDNGFKCSNMRNVNDNYQNAFGYGDKQRIENLDGNKRDVLCRLMSRIDVYINKNKKYGMHDVPGKKRDDSNEEDSDDDDDCIVGSQ